MRADRLISTLLMLQQRGRMSARTIAEELEVSPRTVMRDMEALGAAGVPIYAIRGPAGGYELWEGFRAQLSGLTDDEVRALPLWGRPEVARLFGLSEALDRAQRKVALTLPEEVGRMIDDMASLYLDDRESPGCEPPPGLLEFLVVAIRRTRVISAAHPDWASEPRTLHPLALVEGAEQWSLVFDTSDSRSACSVQWLTDYRTTGRRFRRPEDFDLRAFWMDIQGG